MTDFITYCKNYVADHLGDFEGQTKDAYDLGVDITMGPNYDGTLTYSSYDAKEYLREWWDEASSFFEWEKSNFGETHNPFEDPEGYMVCMVIEGVRTLIDRAVAELGLDGEPFELTPEVAERIVKTVNDDTDYLF